MSDFFIITPDSSILRDFPDEALAPPKDHLAALAAARRGQRRIDPLAALVRNALAAERQPYGSVRRLATRHPASYAIPAEVRAEYHTLFEQRVAHYTAAGRSAEAARQLATDDLGCVEFFAFMREREASPSLRSRPEQGREGVLAA